MNDYYKKIDEIFPHLSKSQQKVAKYIHDHHDEIAFLPVTLLAKKIGVSDTTIIRFCMELGFRGYSDFRNSFKERLQSGNITLNKLESNVDTLSKDNIYKLVINRDINNLSKMLDNEANQLNFDKLIDLICTAKRVYTIGQRGAAPLATTLSLRLNLILKNVRSLSAGIGNFLDEIACIEPDDLVIAINFPRHDKMVVEAIKYLKKKKITIVLITDSSLSNIKDDVDLIFTCETKSDTFVDSYTSCMSLIYAIFTAVALHDNERTRITLTEMEELFKIFDSFVE